MSQQALPRQSWWSVCSLALAVLLCVSGAEGGSTHNLNTMKRRALVEQEEFASDRVILLPKPNVVMALAAENEGLQFQKPAGLQGAIVYTITDGMPVESKIEELRNHPAVAMVEPDYKVQVQWVPDDTNYNMQWHHKVIGSEKAWDTVTGSPDVKVCHVDSGVRVDHPDLAPNVLKGWNFVPAGQKEGTPPPKAGTPEYFNYNDTYGHGTHTAGIIGAVGNNLAGVAGMNWNIKLLVCRFIWNDGSGYVSDAMNCIKLCRQEGAMITSNSWGGIGYSSFLEREIASTQEAGQLFVVASGNSGVDLEDVPLYPTSYKTDNMISVASSGEKDYVSAFSNIGQNTVHLLAPGEGIYSTFMDGGYKAMWGTSMACPLVAGTAALLQAQALSRGVELGYADLKALITGSVDPASDAKTKTITGGRLNAAAALQALDTLLTQRGVGKATIPAPQAPSPSPSPPPPPPVPSPPLAEPAPTGEDGATGFVPLPVCGTTPVAGLGTAYQSSTEGANQANQAIDGDCRKRRPSLGACAQTTSEPDPWWVVKLAAPKTIQALGIQTSTECGCVADLVGTSIMVGMDPWTSAASAANYTDCARVAGIVRGQRKVFTCDTAATGGTPPVGQYIAIWRPSASARQLTLCEVDVVFGPDPELEMRSIEEGKPAKQPKRTPEEKAAAAKKKAAKKLAAARKAAAKRAAAKKVAAILAARKAAAEKQAKKANATQPAATTAAKRSMLSNKTAVARRAVPARPRLTKPAPSKRTATARPAKQKPAGRRLRGTVMVLAGQQQQQRQRRQ